MKQGRGTEFLEDEQYVSGTLVLKSIVNLEIGMEEKFLVSKGIRDYREDVHHNRYRNERARRD